MRPPIIFKPLYLPPLSSLWKKEEEINIDGYIVRRDLLVSRESSSSGVSLSLSTSARRTKNRVHNFTHTTSKGMIKRERKGKTNAGREIKSRRGTESQQYLIPREWIHVGSYRRRKQSCWGECSTMNFGAVGDKLPMNEIRQLLVGSWRTFTCISRNSSRHFPHKTKKGPLTLLSKLSPFFWQPTTKPTRKRRRVQISLSPPCTFNNKLRLWHLFTTENREWFPLPFWEFVHLFIPIDPPWQLLLFLLLDPINLLNRARVSDQRHKSSRLRVDTVRNITMCVVVVVQIMGIV